MDIFIHKTTPDAVVPVAAYNGTSAAFDITCIEDTVIPAKKSANVPNGLCISIHERDPYYMMVHLRSSLGINKELICHPGIIDAGYTGVIGIKLYNLGDEDIIIHKGDRYAQMTVHHKERVNMLVLDDKEFESFSKDQCRGARGFGSSNTEHKDKM